MTKQNLKYIIMAAVLCTMAACKDNPRNTYGGPSNNPHDTSASRRDTSSVGLRTDGRQ
ncbi:hypothetical protein [Mucilaginibacter sp. CSA2-8R]|uniref:hypothetical protein n=1 Tax=Mucilaginibacter sp. CSA2-8R TaxID=3141542 RepID=UPI00315D3EB4